MRTNFHSLTKHTVTWYTASALQFCQHSRSRGFSSDITNNFSNTHKLFPWLTFVKNLSFHACEKLYSLSSTHSFVLWETGVTLLRLWKCLLHEWVARSIEPTISHHSCHISIDSGVSFIAAPSKTALSNTKPTSAWTSSETRGNSDNNNALRYTYIYLCLGLPTGLSHHVSGLVL